MRPVPEVDISCSSEATSCTPGAKEQRTLSAPRDLVVWRRRRGSPAWPGDPGGAGTCRRARPVRRCRSSRHPTASTPARSGRRGTSSWARRLSKTTRGRCAAKWRLREHLSGSSTKVLSTVSPREDPNEGSYPRVRESVEPVPGGLIDPVFGLALVLLRELLLEACQRISARISHCVLAPRTQDRSPHSLPSASLRARPDWNVNDLKARFGPASCSSFAGTPRARHTTRVPGAPSGRVHDAEPTTRYTVSR